MPCISDPHGVQKDAPKKEKKEQNSKRENQRFATDGTSPPLLITHAQPTHPTSTHTALPPMSTPSTITVAVGSQNPCKINAVKDAFALCFPDASLVVDGCEVDSGVAAQPFSDEETYNGALNRARGAEYAWAQTHDEQPPTFAVGLEGGVKEELTHLPSPLLAFEWLKTPPGEEAPKKEALDDPPTGTLHCFAWMVVVEVETGWVGAAKTGSFPLPRPVAALVREGVELGEADDRVSKGFGWVGGFHLFTHSFTHSFVSLFILSFIHPPTYLPRYSSGRTASKGTGWWVY